MDLHNIYRTAYESLLAGIEREIVAKNLDPRKCGLVTWSEYNEDTFSFKLCAKIVPIGGSQDAL